MSVDFGLFGIIWAFHCPARNTDNNNIASPNRGSASGLSRINAPPPLYSILSRASSASPPGCKTLPSCCTPRRPCLPSARSPSPPHSRLRARGEQRRRLLTPKRVSPLSLTFSTPLRAWANALPSPPTPAQQPLVFTSTDLPAARALSLTSSLRPSSLTAPRVRLVARPSPAGAAPHPLLHFRSQKPLRTCCPSQSFSTGRRGHIDAMRLPLNQRFVKTRSSICVF